MYTQEEKIKEFEKLVNKLKKEIKKNNDVNEEISLYFIKLKKIIKKNKNIIDKIEKKYNKNNIKDDLNKIINFEIDLFNIEVNLFNMLENLSILKN